MLCIRCGATLSDPEYCSACGTDIRIYKKLIRLSNTWYNMGLEKAQVRNLSGAMQDLRYSLELNKKNTSARNLLGLIYFEVGDVAAALTEWIISRSLEPQKNPADEYINAIQANQARLETVNQTMKKFNQSLTYCLQGSEDLAVIQLKKVLSLNPRFVKAHQLLALLYIRSENYDRAERELLRALAIDRTDNLTLRYQAELEALTGHAIGSGAKEDTGAEGKKPSRQKGSDIISYTSGNETIIMPATYKENTGVNVFLNIFIGLVVGVALMWFLVLPAKLTSVRGTANEQVRQYSDELASKETQLQELQNQLDSYQTEQTEEEETAEQTGGSYELLIDAYASFQAGDTQTAADKLSQVTADDLSDNAKAIYNQIYATVYADQVKALYDAGSAAYDSGDYETAITNLSQVVDFDVTYDNGYAVYYLARSYEKQGQNDPAVENFQKFIDNFPGTERATYSRNAIARLQQ